MKGVLVSERCQWLKYNWFTGHQDAVLSDSLSIKALTMRTLRCIVALCLLIVPVQAAAGGRPQRHPKFFNLSPMALWQEQKPKVETWLSRDENRVRMIRLAVFLLCSRNSVVSILNDTWELERHPGSLKREVHNPFVRRNVARRVERDRYLRKLVGAGYTPRLVWLYGVMLRGVLQCTAIPKVFNPPIGWGAGAVLAARFAVREWLPCILLGWYGSEWYWKRLFGVNGAPDNGKSDFDGVPIAIKKVRV